MKRKKQKGCLILLDAVDRETTKYALLCLQFGRAIGYAIYIERGEAHAIELIRCRRKDATEIFSKIVRGELSPMHLHEVISDQRAMSAEKLEIFC